MSDLYTPESPEHIEASYWLTHFFIFGVMEMEIAKKLLDECFLDLVQIKDPKVDRPVTLIEFAEDSDSRETSLRFLSYWDTGYAVDKRHQDPDWELQDEYRLALKPDQTYAVNRQRFVQEKGLLKKPSSEFLIRCPIIDWTPPKGNVDEYLTSLTPEERDALHEDPLKAILK